MNTKKTKIYFESLICTQLSEELKRGIPKKLPKIP